MTPNRRLISGHFIAISMLTLWLSSADVASSDDLHKGAFAETIKYAQARAVKIYGASIGRVSGFGTGIIVSPDGDILTAQGVHLTGYRVRVTLPNGKMHDAKVVRRSPSLQLALLKIAAKTPDYFELPQNPTAKRGDWILAVSNAFKVADGKEELSVNLGVASLRTRMEVKRLTSGYDYYGEVLLIDAITSNPGAAGGAIVTADNQLAGMIGKVIEDKNTNTRLNYAVPNDVLGNFLAGNVSDPKVVGVNNAKAVLGLRLFRLGGRNAPAYIDRVLPGSPAAAARLRVDDLIVSVAGRQVKTLREYQAVVDQLTPGEEIVLIVKRGRSVMEFKLTPTAEKGDDQ